jgi:hypothetical protein
MPQFDKTGPQGMGPGTGRGMGACGTGKGFGRGYGRGCGRGLDRRRFNVLSGEEKKELLKTEIEDLKNELKLAEEEMKGLESK